MKETSANFHPPALSGKSSNNIIRMNTFFTFYWLEGKSFRAHAARDSLPTAINKTFTLHRTHADTLLWKKKISTTKRKRHKKWSQTSIGICCCEKENATERKRLALLFCFVFFKEKTSLAWKLHRLREVSDFCESSRKLRSHDCWD